jgi:glutathione peroxidase
LTVSLRHSLCSANHDVHFPLFSKISVLGEDQHPPYVRLIAAQTAGIGDGPVHERLEGYDRHSENPVDVRPADWLAPPAHA